MEPEALVRELDGGEVVAVSRDDLAALLDLAEITQDDSTGIAGRIRTLRLGDRVLVQERTPKGQLYIRKLESVEAAHRFVQSRLDAYERMWDG
jgi:hypothetical protein